MWHLLRVPPNNCAGRLLLPTSKTRRRIGARSRGKLPVNRRATVRNGGDLRDSSAPAASRSPVPCSRSHDRPTSETQTSASSVTMQPARSDLGRVFSTRISNRRAAGQRSERLFSSRSMHGQPPRIPGRLRTTRSYTDHLRACVELRGLACLKSRGRDWRTLEAESGPASRPCLTSSRT